MKSRHLIISICIAVTIPCFGSSFDNKHIDVEFIEQNEEKNAHTILTSEGWSYWGHVSADYKKGDQLDDFRDLGFEIYFKGDHYTAIRNRYAKDECPLRFPVVKGTFRVTYGYDNEKIKTYNARVIVGSICYYFNL